MDVLEGLALGNIEGNNGSNSPAVIRISDSSEAFLSSSVPDLIFDRLALDKCGFSCELNSYGGLGIHIEGVVDEAGEKVGLSNSGVSYHDYLKQEIKLLLPAHAQ